MSRRGLSWLGRRVLDLLAVAGSICILLAIGAVVLGCSIMLFATGSMAPTIPAGSAALVREVPATELRAGDVVTVDRAGALPVTHRIVEILAVEGETVTFTMQGDANAAPDPAPYAVERARVVLAAVPGVAPAIQAMQQPLALGGVTLAGAALVTWAFWPRRERVDDEGAALEDAEPAGR